MRIRWLNAAWRAALALVAVLHLAGAATAQSDDATDPNTRAARRVGAPARDADAERQQLRARVTERMGGKQRSHALVLGISEFEHRGSWSNLPGVAAEIEQVTKVLELHDFHVVDDREAFPGQPVRGQVTHEQLRQAIAKFVQTHGNDPANRLVIYIASHGHAEEKSETRKRGFLVASNSVGHKHPDFEKTAYSVAELEHQLAHIQAQHVFLMFNACFSGALVPRVGTRAASGPGADNASRLPEETLAWSLELLRHDAQLVLTAGSDGQQVPDKDNPFARALTGGLLGAADLDGDGLILGTELAQHVRGQVARETRRPGTDPNDPVFAVLSKRSPGADPAEGVDPSQRGDFVFLSPRGVGTPAQANAEEAVARRRAARLPSSEFTDCADCPVMVSLPGRLVEDGAADFALARTETTFAEWDACFRELGCQRWIDDRGRGRGSRPVSGLSWLDVLDFVEWLNRRRGPDSRCTRYRPPTGKEWVAAAAASTTTQFPWGESLGQGRAHCADCGSPFDTTSAAPTASFLPNDLRLYDMIGNLWEWTEEPDAACAARDFNDERCPRDGHVYGGAYSTRLNRESLTLARALIGGSGGRDRETVYTAGTVPRTTNRPEKAVHLPTVGLRVACDVRR